MVPRANRLFHAFLITPIEYIGTVDREIFVVKIFSRIPKNAKIFLAKFIHVSLRVSGGSAASQHLYYAGACTLKNFRERFSSRNYFTRKIFTRNISNAKISRCTVCSQDDYVVNCVAFPATSMQEVVFQINIRNYEPSDLSVYAWFHERIDCFKRFSTRPFSI